MSAISDVTSGFELSRIHAEGWQAAKKLLAARKGALDPAEANARNPHTTPETRARWTQGFVEAIASVAASPGKRRESPWRQTAKA